MRVGPSKLAASPTSGSFCDVTKPRPDLELPVFAGTLVLGSAAVEVERHEENDEDDEAVTDAAGNSEELVPVLAEDIADGGAGEGPGGGSSEAVGEKIRVFHLADPGEEGGHAPQTRAEASYENRFAAVLLEVTLDLAEAFRVE